MKRKLAIGFFLLPNLVAEAARATNARLAAAVN